MFKLALTGSIGMGKSTVAALFAEQGIPVWDADAAVRRLYASGGKAVPDVAKVFPEAIQDGAVDRSRLRDLLRSEEDFETLNAIVHPRVATDREVWATSQSGDLAVFDIPLVFETGSAEAFDAIAVVDVAPDIQRDRVLARPNMTDDLFEKILDQQMPNVEKVARADFVIPTRTLPESRAKILEILREIRESLPHA